MLFKILSGLISVALLVMFIWPVVWKLKDVALTSVVAIGVVMMLVDLWQSMRSNED